MEASQPTRRYLEHESILIATLDFNSLVGKSLFAFLMEAGRPTNLGVMVMFNTLISQSLIEVWVIISCSLQKSDDAVQRIRIIEQNSFWNNGDVQLRRWISANGRE